MTNEWPACLRSAVITLRDPDDETVLIEGVLFRANYLGSTQLVSTGRPSKSARMVQAQEAVGRIKVGGATCSPSRPSPVALRRTIAGVPRLSGGA